MTEIVLLTPEEIADVVRHVIRDELARAKGPDPDQLLKADEAADLIAMTPNALRVATSRGEIPCVRRGRSVRYRRADLLGAWS